MPFIGEIRIFAGNFAPVGWEFCHGQLLPISENATLFTLIGTTYGGDGESTFAVPDLRGRAPLHPGTLGANSYMQGEMAGAEAVTLTSQNLPPHIHRAIAGQVYIPALGENPGTALVPDNNYPAITPGRQVYSSTKHTTARMAPLQVNSPAGPGALYVLPAGGSQPKDNMQPYLAVNFIISLYGDFPTMP